MVAFFRLGHMPGRDISWFSFRFSLTRNIFIKAESLILISKEENDMNVQKKEDG